MPYITEENLETDTCFFINLDLDYSDLVENKTVTQCLAVTNSGIRCKETNTEDDDTKEGFGYCFRWHQARQNKPTVYQLLEMLIKRQHDKEIADNLQEAMMHSDTKPDVEVSEQVFKEWLDNKPYHYEYLRKKDVWVEEQNIENKDQEI